MNIMQEEKHIGRYTPVHPMHAAEILQTASLIKSLLTATPSRSGTAIEASAVNVSDEQGDYCLFQ